MTANLTTNTTQTSTSNAEINVHQLCFFLAFLAPVGKLLEVPALLAYYAKGDLLLPAFLQFLLQFGGLMLWIYLASHTQKSLYELLADKIGNVGARIVYFIFSAYFVFSILLPILDMERFVYTAFFDTAPSFFVFAPFFFLSGYICTKSLKAFARSADVAMPLFIVAFTGLMAMSVGEADFSNLLPILGTPLKSTSVGILRSFGHFSDTALLLPMIGAYKYKKGDGKKLVLSFWGGAIFVLIFLSVFFGVFGPIASRQAYAFDKVAQYFQALDVVGRLDLMLVYIMTALLMFYYCLPLQLSVLCFAKGLNTERRVIISAALNVLLFIFTVYFNKNYNIIYYIFTTNLFWVHLIFAYLLPALCLLCLIPSRKNKSGSRNKNAYSERIKSRRKGGESC